MAPCAKPCRPAGFGTLDEFFEILRWSQLGLHAKHVGRLNIA
jgi:predicted Rossmann-fold nucleotide-binding protein